MNAVKITHQIEINGYFELLNRYKSDDLLK